MATIPIRVADNPGGETITSHKRVSRYQCMPRLSRSSVDIEVSTDNEVSRITGEQIVKQLFA